MRRLRIFIALLALAGAACTSDTLTRTESPTGPSLPPIHPGASASEIYGDLEYLGLYVTNNDRSFTAKFDQVLAALALVPPDTVLAIAATLNLVEFLELKSGQYPDQNALVYPPSGGGPMALSVFVDLLVERLWEFVGLTGAVCEIPLGSPGTFCDDDPGNVNAFVYFPPGIFEQLTYVAVENLGSVFDLGSGLDEYGTFIKVTVQPSGLNFAGEPLLPLVVVCFPDGAISPEAASRSLLGHLLDNGVFELLGTPDYSAYPPEVLAKAQAACGAPVTAPAFGAVPTGLFGRLAHRAFSAFAPAPVHAQYLAAFGGVGGSPEEFSDFGAVDPYGTAFGGAGGSPEEFAPPAFGPINFVNSSTATVVGTVGTTTSALPTVTIKTDLDQPIAGVNVTFSVSPATTVTPAGAAGICGGGTEDVLTDLQGQATPTCLAFGTVAGFSNLKAEFDPTSLGLNKPDGTSYVQIVAAGESSDNSVNWLVESQAGAAANITKVAGDGQTAPAFSSVPVNPKVRVTDTYGNDVSGETVTWDPGGPSSGAVNPGTSNTDTDGTTSTVWTLGPGTNTLIASIAAGPEVQFTATGVVDLVLANACFTGGQKDDVTKFGFRIPSEKGNNAKYIFGVGLHLSSNGAPGASEDYEVTLRAWRAPSSGSPPAIIATAKASLQSSSNSSKGVESEIFFDFGSTPIPPLGAGNQPDIFFTMTALDVSGTLPAPLPPNRVVNMNGGQCQPGAKKCSTTPMPPATKCAITETLNGADYRQALPARIYVNK